MPCKIAFCLYLCVFDGGTWIGLVTGIIGTVSPSLNFFDFPLCLDIQCVCRSSLSVSHVNGIYFGLMLLLSVSSASLCVMVVGLKISSFYLILSSLQLRNAPNLLRQEHALLVRWFSCDGQPSVAKRDGMPFLWSTVLSFFQSRWSLSSMGVRIIFIAIPDKRW